MHFYLTRRHRRQLLFPPGLLALGWLLWLGCVALKPWEEKLIRKGVVQLTMPTLPRNNNDEFAVHFELPIRDSVCKSCLWHETYLTGSIANAREQEQVAKAVRSMMADTAHSSGVIIHFVPGSHYSQMVFALDVLAQENVRKYWLDIYHGPLTIYAFAEPCPSSARQNINNCMLCNDVVSVVVPPEPAPFAVCFDDWITDFWHFAWLRPLLQPEWRASVWLVSLISLLGCWQIGRAWRVA